MTKKPAGKIKESIRDIKSVERYLNFSIRGNAHQIKSDDSDFSQMMNDYSVYLTDKEFLQKWAEKLIGKGATLEKYFDVEEDGDFDEHGLMEEFSVTEEYYITFKDDSEISVNWSVPDAHFLSADSRDAEAGTMAHKYIREYEMDNWDIDIDSLAQEVSGGKKVMAKGGETSSLKVENEKDLEEVAKYMVKAVKKHSWDLKDLIHYFEKDNNFDYKVRVKIADHTSIYEMPKNYDSILKLLKEIVEGNGKKLSSGDKKMAKGGKITAKDAGSWVDGSRGIYQGEMIIEIAEKHGFLVDEKDVANKKADGEHYHDLIEEAIQYLNDKAPEGYYFGNSDSNSDFGLWESEEMGKGGLTRAKARQILHDGEAHGKPLTKKQRGYMGAVASGYAKKGKGGNVSALDGTKKYNYGITFRTITEESAQQSDWAKTGWEVEREDEELQHIIKSASWDYGIREFTGSWWESTSPDEDRDYFEKGIEKYYDLHITHADGSELSKEEEKAITDLLKSNKVHFDESEKKWYGKGGTTGGWTGMDADLETSLEEYHFVVTRNEHCKEADEHWVIYKISDNTYGHGYVRERELDNIIKGEEWASEEDVASFLETNGSTKEEWLKSRFVNKLYDLISYWGYENIMGTDYSPNDKKWAYEQIGIEDSSMAKGGKTDDMNYEKDILPVLAEAVKTAWKPIAKKYHLYEEQASEIESKSGSGFIAFTDGGYTIHAFNPLTEYDSTGVTFPEKSQKQIDKWIKECYDDTLKEHDDEESEEFKDAVSECIGGIAVDFDLRAVYYKPDNRKNEFKGKNAIYVFGIINEDLKDRKDMIEEGFSFDSISELKEKLPIAINKVLTWYKVGDKMALGGKAGRSSSASDINWLITG